MNVGASCVISSFITKPQPLNYGCLSLAGCVISSFITKPQLSVKDQQIVQVALYPLSSPNHNPFAVVPIVLKLRYILFHHQTTTFHILCKSCACCVISSFITKPQPSAPASPTGNVALYPLSSPNHNSISKMALQNMLRYILFHHQTTTQHRYGSESRGCVISSFITKPQPDGRKIVKGCALRYILFHHQTTTFAMRVLTLPCCVISSFITKPQRAV